MQGFQANMHMLGQILQTNMKHQLACYQPLRSGANNAQQRGFAATRWTHQSKYLFWPTAASYIEQDLQPERSCSDIS